MYIEFADVFKQRMIELASGMEGKEKFVELMTGSEVMHIFNGSTETHGFNIRPGDDISSEDIQLMADAILDVIKSEENLFVVSLDDQYQASVINIRADKEPELIGRDRTEGYGSGQIFQPIFDSLSKPGRMNEGFM
ncbi:MAG: hypothetical protein J6T68_02830 [Candidatus Methanomethylophilaceae archaeon]|nr:hypothetical protein [Candidatus Methanomethylophilaceae archaeon]